MHHYRVIREEEDQIEVEFDEGVADTDINIYRRRFYQEVETICFTFAYIRANNSSFPDKVVGHRFSLVTLRPTKPIEEFKEGYASKISNTELPGIKFTVTKAGPARVMAGDLVSEDKSLEIVYPETPLISLAEGQSIDIDFFAVKAKASEHARHQPGMCRLYEKDGRARLVIESYGSFTPKELLEKVTSEEKA